MDRNTLRIHITNDQVYVENGMTISLATGGPCWIIDPGLPPQAKKIIQYVRQESLETQAIVLTHAHADHIAGIDELRDELGAIPVHLGQAEWPALTDPMANLSGLMGSDMATKVTDPRDLIPGETMELGDTSWLILDTSGHSPGGRSIYCSELGIVVVGDALFAGSIGRTDFPNSNGDQLLRNLRDNILTLPDETRVLCGHGPETTVGRERTSNPFLT